MDIATIVGVIGGSGMVLAVMMLAGPLLMFWDLQSVLVVLGGGGFATMIRWPLKQFIGGVGVGMNCVFDHVAAPQDLINEIVQLADVARKQSVLRPLRGSRSPRRRSLRTPFRRRPGAPPG